MPERGVQEGDDARRRKRLERDDFLGSRKGCGAPTRVAIYVVDKKTQGNVSLSTVLLY